MDLHYYVKALQGGFSLENPIQSIKGLRKLIMLIGFGSSKEGNFGATKESTGIAEVYIGANQWGSIPYNRVASVAMKFYKEKFLKHDRERFSKYMEDVKSGKSTIAAGALLPHEIIASLSDGDGGQVAELQWKRMVDDLLKQGENGVQGRVCEKDGLGMNTDFKKVFDLILEVAVNGNLKEDQMIKRVFVFSDMEFDEASCNPWETDYEAIKRKYREKGYGCAVPRIVFGIERLKGNPSAHHFCDGTLNPQAVMEAAISGQEYEKLRVLD
ncbi:hypothetical protein K1719_002547 [Acacia pycnantha]|nr:hypothetical protein K1719_002547 [Acacia pycnantha]